MLDRCFPILIAALFATPAHAVSIDYVSQQRTVGANSNAESDVVSAPDLAPFVANATAVGVGDVGQGGGSASASQNSTLGAQEIVAALSASDFGSPNAASSFGVEFSLAEEAPYSLAGSIFLSVNPDGFVILERLGGPVETLFDSREPPLGFGGGSFDLSGTLEPGNYALRARVEAIGNSGAHTADFVFAVPEPSSGVLALLGLAAVACERRRRLA